MPASALRRAVAAVLAAAASSASAQPVEPVLALAKSAQAPLLETLKALCEIESGSRDLEGLARLADLIAARLKALGGDVALVDFGPDVYRMEDTPPRVGRAVRATFRGTGTRKILLIAHMDTVYQKGMLARQPFRVFRDYATLTVLVNADEEISSPGSRNLITQLGAEHDATLSFEASRAESDKLALATAGIGSLTLNVQGRASHAGAAPERGVNAFYEMAHQVLQMRDLSDPAAGVKVNWTVGKAGTNRNVIPETAQAQADVRACCASPTTTRSSGRRASGSGGAWFPTRKSS